MVFGVTAVYARCLAVERLELWDELQDISENNQDPWLVRGDFNLILTEEEKLEGLAIH